MKNSMADSYSILFNNSNGSVKNKNDDVILNAYNNEKNEIYFFKDGSALVGKEQNYEIFKPNKPLKMKLEKRGFDNQFFKITCSRTNERIEEIDELDNRYIVIFEDGSGIISTGDDFLNHEEIVTELEMKKITNQIDLDLDIIKESLVFINNQGRELKSILNKEQHCFTIKNEQKGRKRSP